MKREPVLFINTRFMVDRFHYNKGHVGCTLGYCMDEYSKDPEIVRLNSQVNEQANADLRNLGSQIVSMRPENTMVHIKNFLAIRNFKLIMKQVNQMYPVNK